MYDLTIVKLVYVLKYSIVSKKKNQKATLLNLSFNSVG